MCAVPAAGPCCEFRVGSDQSSGKRVGRGCAGYEWENEGAGTVIEVGGFSEAVR